MDIIAGVILAGVFLFVVYTVGKKRGWWDR